VSGLVVKVPASHAGGPGSIPGEGLLFVAGGLSRAVKYHYRPRAIMLLLPCYLYATNSGKLLFSKQYINEGKVLYSVMLYH